MNTIVTNRTELLFLYDASYCNPNGDPSNENKPRVDQDTGINLVTDVRMKRTIRDFLHELKNMEIFVKTTYDEDNYVKDGKARARYFLETDALASFHEQRDQIDQKILNDCIDVRLFGAVIPLELDVIVKKKGKKDEKKSVKGSITHTGPVQFKIGQSLHKVTTQRIKGTGAFASGTEKSQQSFRVEYILPYSMIGFYGIINEHRAKETQLSEEDVELLYQGIWTGTKHLITRSKSGITPRFMLAVEYRKGNFQISDLDHQISIKSELEDEAIRSVSDFSLDFSQLIALLIKHKDNIKRLRLIIDPNVLVFQDEKTYQGNDEILKLFEKTGAAVTQFDLE